MTAERWQQVKELFCSALEHKVEERAAFLERACDGDDDLRKEVESLLGSFDESDSIIETPVAQAAADLVSWDQRDSLVGKRLGHYEVVSILGTGGMGEVYLAQDTRLNRRVAVKVLSAPLIANQEANDRLWREARAAATLDHPHICAIHEIAEVDGCCFIVMQYVEGKTLAEKLKREKMDLRQVLSIAIQVADALAAAHEAHIIHRDIKPGNIIINEKGRAKVLDFGLAKIAAQGLQAERGAQSEKMLSKSGAVMGTVPFMSPEQVRGQSLDGRTDIFSFGATLYEMSCGRQAFARENDAETISAILRDEPSLAELDPELQPIVQKCLRKNVDERYQTAKDLLVDLQNLEKRLASDSGFTVSPSGSGLEAQSTRILEALSTGKNQPAKGGTLTTVSSSKYLLTTIKRHKVAASVVLVVLLTATLAMVSAKYRRRATAEITPVKSIAVLPFRTLGAEANDQYLGLGIADSIIAKVSQIGALTVRPTSAVRKYVNSEIDSLEAAHQQRVDSVLDGTIQRSGNRLRISINLIRVSDGTSLWADTFNLSFKDIFAMQDEVSRQVASGLRLRLSEAEAARIARRNTSNPEAYNYYAKGMYHFYNISAFPSSRPEADSAIDLFKKAIELDPGYALAHAYLGYSYTRTAVFLEENPALIEQAKQSLATAERLNPQLAEVHAARYFIAFSQYQNWQIETAFRELRLAQQIDPHVGHSELADLYNHVGLEDKAIEEWETALEIDPTNDATKFGYVVQIMQQNRPDDALELNKRFFNRGPNFYYYLEKQMAKEAAPLIDQELQQDPNNDPARSHRLLLMVLQGKHDEAQAAAAEFIATVRKNRGYHHYAYNVARVYASGGKSDEALKWLRFAAANGFPCYPLFERDPYLQPIRKDPAFLQFMAEMKTRWEGYQREFG